MKKREGRKMQHPCCRCGQVVLNDEKSWYGLHEHCFKTWFDLNEVGEFLDLVVRSQSQAPEKEKKGANISFFHGAYRKYSARLEQTSYILKIQQQEYPDLPTTEFLCNQIFESLSISIPNYYLIRFPEKQFCFISKNFMSGLEYSDLIHIYHFVKGGMGHDCESLVTIIGQQTNRRIDQENLVYLTLADSLIGNHDRHGRNLGFIRSAKGVLLAPFYDNPSALALEEESLLGADLQPRGSIFTRDSDKPSMRDYVQEWKRLGYAEVVDRFRSLCSLEKIHGLIEASYLSQKRKKALWRLIAARSEELCDI
jgi:hypothetical protein